MRVSVAPLRVDSGDAAWRTAFESGPSLPITDSFDDLESGGRLAWYHGHSLRLTIRAYGVSRMSGESAPAQDPWASYGKILFLDLDGNASVFWTGHRNPQGLTVDRDGRVQSTEHGPQGVDKLNLIERGGNFGCPFVTSGSPYGSSYWPVGRGGRDHGRFIKPIHGFVPSIGVSNSIQVRGGESAAWGGDLLAVSLRQRTEFRSRCAIAG